LELIVQALQLLMPEGGPDFIFIPVRFIYNAERKKKD
jgi:hypothetical protein